MIYSKYQEDFFNCLIATNSNICLKATAGSGKTTTAVQATKFLPYGKTSLFCAFNKHIVVELKEKLPTTVQCQTLHSIGLRAIFNHFPPGSVKIKDNKQIQFIEHLFDKEKTRKEKWTKVYETDKILRLVRATMTGLSKEEIEALTANHNLFPEPQIIEAAIMAGNSLIEYNSDPEKYGMEIDFQDMVELCVRDKEIRLPKFDFVIVDECQDCSRLDQLFIEKLIKPVTGRLVTIGDPHQCQPTGTKVLMYDGSEKNIEDIVIGDKVVSYPLKIASPFKGFYKYHRWGSEAMKNHGVSVLETASREVDEKLVKVVTGIGESSYTFNHRCLVKFNKNKIKAHAVYLMQKGDCFRIGITPLWMYSNTSVTGRAKQEKADKFWILEICENRREAYLREQLLSVEYGIPQMVFRVAYGQKISQTYIDSFYNSLDKEKLYSRVLSLLEDKNKDISLPFWRKRENGHYNYYSKNHFFKINACNIFSEYMEVGWFNEKRYGEKTLRGMSKFRPEPILIKEVRVENYRGTVHSLKIDKFETYIADKILTHNSIYSFRGADVSSFEYFENRPNTVTLPLSISYRMSKKLVANAKKIYPEIEPWEQAKEGIEVKKGKVEDMRTGDMVLSRNLRPLIEVFFSLIEQNKKCTIIGKELEEGLLALIEHLSAESSTEEMYINLDERLVRVANELSRKGITTPQNHPRYEAFEEKISVLKRVARACGSVGEVRDKLDSIFSDNSVGAIKLSTIHKAKGLENDRVFLIETFEKKKLIPNKYAVTKDQLIQEKNLQFVAYTRAKSELIKIYL